MLITTRPTINTYGSGYNKQDVLLGCLTKTRVQHAKLWAWYFWRWFWNRNLYISEAENRYTYSLLFGVSQGSVLKAVHWPIMVYFYKFLIGWRVVSLALTPHLSISTYRPTFCCPFVCCVFFHLILPFD